MTDVFTPAKRSEVMSRIRGVGNKETEVALVNLMRRNGIKGWRRRQALFGKPDFIFRAARLAIFVDGCFWHGCSKHSKVPRNNRPFWLKKLEGNKKRDRTVNRVLRSLGWRVLRIWEHELTQKCEHRCVARIRRALAARVSSILP